MKLAFPIEENFETKEAYEKAVYLYNKDYELIYGEMETDDEGNLISCCGDILDEDIMICPTCREHC